MTQVKVKVETYLYTADATRLGSESLFESIVVFPHVINPQTTHTPLTSPVAGS